MKNQFRKGFLTVLAVLLVLSLTACSTAGGSGSTASSGGTEADSSSQGEPVAEERTLTIWQSAMTGALELENPEEEWVFTKMCRTFEEQNPGVTIESTYEKDQQVLQSKLKAAVLANDAPDLANIYSGYLVTTLSDIFVDITSYIPAEDSEKILGWEAVSKDMKLGNPIYGYPAAGAEMGLLLYNKELTGQAGVDLEGEGAPKNAEEFMAALQKIKDAGILPIVGSDQGYNPLFMFSFGSWWTQQVGTEQVTSNSLGKTKFAEDTAFIDSLGMVAQMYQEGFINEDYTTRADALGDFLTGKAAMLSTGNWDVQNGIDGLGEENLGVYMVPNFNENVKYNNATIGGVGQAMCVVSTCEDPELAVNFLSFISNKENVVSITKILSKIPQRTDITAEEIGWAGKPAFEKVLAAASENLLPWNDNSMQSDVMNEYYKQTTLAVIGTITVEECAAALDAKAAEVNG